MSTSTPRRSSSGSTVAQLPASPTESGVRSRLAARHSRSASSRSVATTSRYRVLDPPGQPGRVDVDDQRDAVVERHRERLRAAHPAAAAGHGERAGQCPAEPLGGDGGERLVGALQDALGADVDPRPGGHLPVHGQPGLPRGGGTPASWPSRRPGWSWRSAPAAPTRGCAARRPACPTGPAWSRPRAARSASRTIASNAPPGPGGPRRCRRRRPGRRGARRPRGRGCSSASAAGPRSATTGRSARCRAERGRGGRLP